MCRTTYTKFSPADSPIPSSLKRELSIFLEAVKFTLLSKATGNEHYFLQKGPRETGPRHPCGHIITRHVATQLHIAKATTTLVSHRPIPDSFCDTSNLTTNSPLQLPKYCRATLRKSSASYTRALGRQRFGSHNAVNFGLSTSEETLISEITDIVIIPVTAPMTRAMVSI